MPINEMAGELLAERNTGGHKAKIYKTQVDQYRGELLAADIQNRIQDLAASEARGKVDFRNLEDVQQRTYQYLQACSVAQVFPSVMGLAVHGYGISRQALNQYIQRNPSTAATEFILKAKDTIADILVNASLSNNANPVQAIFQLKNHFSHTDSPEPITAREDPLGDSVTAAEIAAKYQYLPE